jgi:hypothetical protein
LTHSSGGADIEHRKQDEDTRSQRQPPYSIIIEEGGRMMGRRSIVPSLLAVVVILLVSLLSVEANAAFVTSSSSSTVRPALSVGSTSILQPVRTNTNTNTALNMDMNMDSVIMSHNYDCNSVLVSVDGIDPTTVLSQLLGGFLNSPAILLVPMGAAFGVASLIAFFIFSYSQPAVEDDE